MLSAFVLNRAHAKAGETVLIHGASGGVGHVIFFEYFASNSIQFIFFIALKNYFELYM